MTAMLATRADPMGLTPTERALVQRLRASRGRVVHWTMLAACVHDGLGLPESERALLRVHVAHIRRKLGPGAILTARRFGYRAGSIASEASS